MDALTLPRLAALNRYWADHPPVHLMIAAYLGIKPGSEKRRMATFDDFVAAVAAR